jgi:hypothetical protein
LGIILQGLQSLTLKVYYSFKEGASEMQMRGGGGRRARE